MYSKAAKFFTVVILSAGFLSLGLPQPFAQACTGIMLRNSDGTFVNGRTLELTDLLEPGDIVTLSVGRYPGLLLRLKYPKERP